MLIPHVKTKGSSVGASTYTLTVDHTQVDDFHTDFPVYVDLSDMPTAFWDTVTSDGGDIRCYKSDGTTELPREVVSATFDYASNGGELWIKYSGTLSSTVDTDIIVTVDGTSTEPSASSTYGSENVWTNNYLLVSNDGGATDATGNGYDGVAKNGVTIGGVSAPIGEATDFDSANNHWIELPYSGLKVSFPFTQQIWINQDSELSFRQIFGNDNWAFQVEDYAGANITVSNSGDIISATGQNKGDNGSNNRKSYITNGHITTGNWARITAVFDGFTDRRVFVNGIKYSGTYSGTATAMEYSLLSGFIGQPAYDGKLAQPVFINDTVSDEWAQTTWNNQNSPSTFYTIT